MSDPVVSQIKDRPMNLARLLRRSFAAPVRHFKSAVVIFWPTWIAAALLIVTLELNAHEGVSQQAGQGLWFTAFVIWFALMAAALVRWHRLLLLGEAPATANLPLTSNDFAFLRRYLIIGLIYIILMAIAIVTTVFGLLVAEPDPYQAIDWLVSAAMFAAISGPLILTALLIPNMCLRLPALALAEDGGKAPVLTFWSVERWKLALGIAITTTAITVLTGLYTLVSDLASISTEWIIGPFLAWAALGTILSVMELTLTPMIFAAFLSFAYLALIDQSAKAAP